MNGMKRSARVVALAATWTGVAALLRCSGTESDRSGGQDATAAPPRQVAPGETSSNHLNLLDRVGAAVVHGGLFGLDGDAAAAGDRVLIEEFATSLGEPWFDDGWIEALHADPDAPRRCQIPLAREGDVTLCEVPAGAQGLHAAFVPGGDEAWLIRARVRAPAGAVGGALHTLRLEEATTSPLAQQLLAITPERIAAGRTVPLPASSSGDWQELELFVAPRPKPIGCTLSLVPSDRGLEVDRVELIRLRTAARLRHTPRLACDPATHPLRRWIDGEEEFCDALLVPAGSGVEFALAVPPERPRLRFLPAALGTARDVAVTLSLRVNGAVRWQEERSTRRIDEATSFEPAEIELADVSGSDARFEFSAASAGDAVACFGAPELLSSAPRRDGRRNLLLISLDTTRADHLGCYGDPRGLTPNLDAFAAQGLRFEQVVAPSSWTLPTHMSLFTGQHPILHGLIASPRYVDPVRSRPLAARLRENGWCTAAFTSGGPMVPRNGFGLGFDRYSTNDPLGLTRYNRYAEDVRTARESDADWLAPTLEWLSAHRDQPFFLFVHTFFVHNYHPHDEVLRRFADPSAKVHADLPLVMGEKAIAGDDRALARLKQLYAAALAETDGTLLPRLLGALDELQLADETIVCILADHGEEHLEHGQFGHRIELWRESTRVPWLLRGPGVPVGAVRHDKVDLADVSATLASLLELPPEPLDFGRDQLAPGATDDGEETEFLLLFGSFGEPGSKEALEVGPWKVMRWRRKDGGDDWKLFRIDRDPLETHDLASEQPEILARLGARLEARRRRLERQADDLPGSNILTRDLSAAELERLKGLGYGDE
jgi:arylsulfatase A-like enzyme